jgi:RND family efflux transporter MFP subunit
MTRTTSPYRFPPWGLVPALFLATCGSPRARPAAEKPAESPQAVSVAEVTRIEGDELAVPGTVRAHQRASLSSRISASVLEVPRREGERVAAGAVLVRLDDAALRAAVAAAEASLKAADADLARTESLLKKDAATPRERDEATARAAAARAVFEGARDNLAYGVLRAPFAGRIGSKPVDVGEVVSPGTALIEIEGEGGFEIEATLEHDLAASLRPGLELRALVDGQSGSLTAQVQSVSRAGDPTTHRFQVRADLPAAPGLRSGLFARLVAPSPVSSPRLTVPASAVFRRGGLSGVFVVAEGKARLRWIAAGASAEGRTEVRAGLEAGERVALEPDRLADGARVAERPRAAR